jgi:hypothetical protein
MKGWHATSRDWPHFPEDQLSLFDISAFEDTPEREDLSKGGRVTERSATVDRRRPCRICGELKTDGLPCPKCHENRENMARSAFEGEGVDR